MSTRKVQTLLKIDSSIRGDHSITRTLTAELSEALNPGKTITRDLANGIGQIEEVWAGATFTPVENRTEAQREALSESDALVAELQQADTIVIGVPVYNFSIAANLKSWVDMVCRAGVTFRYTENGPEGLIKDKKVYLVYASGGTPVGSDMDFATRYLKHVLAFIGITGVTVIAAGATAANSEDPLSGARAQIAQIAQEATDADAA